VKFLDPKVEQAAIELAERANAAIMDGKATTFAEAVKADEQSDEKVKARAIRRWEDQH
jgi:uncharacterized protein YbaA (DUF1428 family)